MDGTHGQGTDGVPAAEGVTAGRGVRILAMPNSDKTSNFQMVKYEVVPFSYYSWKSTLISYGPGRHR